MKTLIKFSATWCSPCKALDTTLNSLEGWKDTHVYIQVDIDGNPSLAARHNARSVPTLVVLDQNGLETNRITGNQTKEKLKVFLGVD